MESEERTAKSGTEEKKPEGQELLKEKTENAPESAKEFSGAEEQKPGKIGEVCIADDVVAVIAGLAATEVEGVDSMAGNITKSLIPKLGNKNLSRGVKVDITEGRVTVDLSLNIRYSYNIPEVSAKVQERVMNAIENMTGLKVLEVNVRIAGVNID